jgi:hypothetical protein
MEQLQLQDFERDYFEFLLSDELEQFKGDGSKVTRALLKAFAQQFDDLLGASKEIAEKTNIGTAEGVNLDGCGDIVQLTRAQAAMLSNEVTTDVNDIKPEVLDSVKTPMDILAAHAPYGIVPFTVIDDERYREYLWFKVFLNTNHCTFPDVMKALEAFWTRTPLHYTERPVIGGMRCHATIKVSTPVMRVGSPYSSSLDDTWGANYARLFFLIPIIKAAGVQLLREETTHADTGPAKIRVTSVLPATLTRITMPEATIRPAMEPATVRVECALPAVMARITMPEAEPQE